MNTEGDYKEESPVGFGECLCSDDMSVKQVLECFHALANRKTPTAQAV